MYETYQGHGVRFRYPAKWELREELDEGEVTITVSSMETSFWSLTIIPQRPRPEEVIESAVAAFQEEYEELDVYATEAELCHRESVSRDVEFVCLELLNGAFLRSFRTERFSTLVYYQGTDEELEETREILESISASLECEGDEALFS